MSEQSPQKSSSVTAVTLEAFMNSVLMYAIITTDTEGIITDWSPGAELIFGYTKAEVLGSSAELIFTPEDRQKNVPLKELETARNEGHAPDERWHLRKNGERFFMSGTVTALYDKELIGYVKVARDMTDQKSSEEALQLSELRKNHQLSRLGEEMGAFTLISAEQVKKPVMNLYIDAELLIRSEAAKLSDSGKAMLRRMQSSLRKMNLLLDDMQQLARISTGDVLMKTSLKEAVNAALAGLEKKAGEINAKITCGDLADVFGEASLLEKLFYHLIDNALKFNTSSSPRVDITGTATNELPEEAAHHITMYRVSVKDNGIGIAAGDTEKAFGLFQKVHTDRYKGSGMGLALARKIMHVHDGFIRLYSDENGTVCQCYFPLSTT